MSEKEYNKHVNFLKKYAHKCFSNILPHIDLDSDINLAIAKSLVAYDKSRDIQFNTLLRTVFKNEVLMSYRKATNRGRRDIILHSIYDIIHYDYINGSDITLLDVLPNSDSDLVDDLAFKFDFERAMSTLSEIEKYVFISTVNGVYQKTMCEKLDISQSYVSRIYKRAVKKMKHSLFKYRNVI